MNQKVVIDFNSPFVCLGTLAGITDSCLEVTHGDFHDLRDTQTSRENYVAAALATGIKRNRKRILIFRREIAAVSLLREVVDD